MVWKLPKLSEKVTNIYEKVQQFDTMKTGKILHPFINNSSLSKWNENQFRHVLAGLIRRIHHCFTRFLNVFGNKTLTHWPLGDWQVEFPKHLLSLWVNCSRVITSQKAFDDKSTSVQVMTLCHQATSHYHNQCWPRSMSPHATMS